MESQKLTFTLVFTQTRNFVRNRIKPILLVCLLVTLISSVISYYLFKPETYAQLYLSGDIASYVLFIIIAFVISIIMKSICIATVYNLYVSDKLNPKLLLPRVLENILKITAFYLIIISLLIFIVLFLFLLVSFLDRWLNLNPKVSLSHLY